MKECWFVVETYCFLSLMRAIASSIHFSDEPVFLLATIGNAALVLALVYLTYRANRTASRILSAHILLGVGVSIVPALPMWRSLDVASVYVVLMNLYLAAGAIKLWRMRTLPTRFTDPPHEG